MNYQLVKRIDRNSLFGDKADVLKLVMSDEKETHFLYRVFGSCTGTVKGASKFVRVAKGGEEEVQSWQKLVGEFYAMTRDGHGFTAGQCFLPRDVEESIIAQFEQGILTVEFAYDIFVRYDKQAATSYVFLAQPVMPADDSPAKKMMGNLPALPSVSNVKQLTSKKKEPAPE